MWQYCYSQIDNIIVLLLIWYYHDVIINLTAVNVHFYYKKHLEKSLFAAVGVRLHFKVLKCFAVPV